MYSCNTLPRSHLYQYFMSLQFIYTWQDGYINIKKVHQLAAVLYLYKQHPHTHIFLQHIQNIVLVSHQVSLLFVNTVTVTETGQFTFLCQRLGLQYLRILAGVVEHIGWWDGAPLVSKQWTVGRQWRRWGRVRVSHMRVCRNWRWALEVEGGRVRKVPLRHVVVGTVCGWRWRWCTDIRRLCCGTKVCV